MHTIRRFARARDAVAAVEFALVLPLLLVLYLGTVEISTMIAVDRRVTVVSGTVGDLVARTDADLDPDDLDDYFEAAEGIMLPYSRSPLKQVVSVLVVAANGTSTVSWSCGFNGGTARADNSAYTLPAAMQAISASKWVVLAESSYAYTPLLGNVISAPITLFRVSYYLPRFNALIDLDGSCPT